MGTARYNVQRQRWMIDYHDSKGQRVRELVGPHTIKGDRATKRLADRILRDRELQSEMGKLKGKPSDIPSFRVYAEKYLDRRQPSPNAPSKRVTTYESWRTSVRCHLIPAFGDMRLDTITRDDVKTYLDNRLRQGTHKASSINVTFGHLKTLLQEAVADDYIDKSPTLGVKRLKDEEPSEDEGEDVRAFTKEQWDAFEVAAQEVGQPWATLFLFAYGTGLRRNELLGLQWREVDLSGEPAMVFVRRQLGRKGTRVALKTKRSKRDLDIDHKVVQALLELSRGDDPKNDWVFSVRPGKPISESNFRKAFRNVLTVAGLPEVFTPHSLRHTHASVLFDKDVNLKTISDRLGHSSVAITERVYVHFIRKEQKHVGHLLFSGNRKATEVAEAPNPAPVAAP